MDKSRQLKWTRAWHIGKNAGSAWCRRTHSEAVDNSAHNHLRQMPRRDLQDCTNDIADKTETDSFLATELVAECEGKDGSAESTELCMAVSSLP